MIKKSLEELALFGGQPAFAEQLHVGRPNIGDAELFLSRVREVLNRRWLTNNGPYVQAFERKLCDMTGTRHCIATCNATAALQVLFRALGLTGEVIVPAFTFIATVHALHWLGLRPVFCDVDPRTHSINPKVVSQLVSQRTTCILGVHLWGRPCEIEMLLEIARAHQLKLVFDAAHALGSSYRGKQIGNFGDAEVFSFHATKVCNSFEGGTIQTNDDALAERIRRMINFGFTGYDNVISEGTNAKMSEVCGAMGLTSIECYNAFVKDNSGNYRCYQTELSRMPGIELYDHCDQQSSNFQYVVIEVDESQTGLTRDDLHAVLWAEGILARRYFFPGCHRMEPYRTLFPDAAINLPSTERLSERVLCLPTGMTVRPAHIQTIGKIMAFAISRGPEIHERRLHDPEAKGEN